MTRKKTTGKAAATTTITLSLENFILDVRQELTKRRQIAIVWSAEDVQDVRPDLNDDQAWFVLQQVRRNHDAGCGVNWDVLKDVADMLFPSDERSESNEEDAA